MKEKNNGNDSLGEKIANILTPIPTLFDPEEDKNEDTSAKLVDKNFEEDYEESDERTVAKPKIQSFPLLEEIDERYMGKGSSRKDVLEDENSKDSIEDNKSSDITKTSVDFDSDENEDEDDENAFSQEDLSEEEGGYDDEEEVSSSKAESSVSKSNFKHMNKIDMKNEISKGACVRNQLNIWENLIEMRIQMQKGLIASNKMTQKVDFLEIKNESGPEFMDKVSETKRNTIKMLDKLLQLQTILLKNYPETKGLNKGVNANVEKENEDDEIPSDTEDEKLDDSSDNNEVEVIPRKKMKIEDYENKVNRTHNLYRNYRNSVIQKWNEKTRVASAKSTSSTHSVVNQIDYILNDRERLIRKSQMKKSNYDILGCKPEVNEKINDDKIETDLPRVIEEYNNNIYDDDDFYHHLLRELIEYKSSDVSNPSQLGKQWIQLQNLRSKMKRKIDTRATKGRKVRYTVHSKLVNFMAPIDQELMTDEAKNELFGSLFSKKQISIKSVQT